MTIIEITREDYPIIFADLVDKYKNILDKEGYNGEEIKNGKFVIEGSLDVFNFNNYSIQFIKDEYHYKTLDYNLKVKVHISNTLVVEVKKATKSVFTIVKAL